MMAAFVTVVGAVGLGLIGLLRLARGHAVVPPRRQAPPSFNDARLRRALLILGVGLMALLLTRWLAAAVAAAALVAFWPRVFGGTAAGRRGLRKVEAIAIWTESLRDTASAAAGLEQAIPATV